MPLLKRLRHALSLMAIALVVGAVMGPGAVRAAGDEHWEPFFMVPAGLISVDRNSVTRDDDRVQLTFELWYEHPAAVKDGKLDYLRSDIRLGCRGHTYTTLSERFYDMAGRQVAANLKPSPSRSPSRGTFESALISAHCPAAPSGKFEPDQSAPLSRR
jgi:hypothetical protein